MSNRRYFCHSGDGQRLEVCRDAQYGWDICVRDADGAFKGLITLDEEQCRDLAALIAPRTDAVTAKPKWEDIE